MKYNIKLLLYIALSLDLICAIIHAICPEAIPVLVIMKAIAGSLIPILMLELIDIGINIVKLLKIIGRKLWRNNKYWIYYTVIILVSLIYPIYIFINNDLDSNTVLSFYGALITFWGTFSLGYFTFVREIKYQNEIKIQKIKLLYDMLNQIDKEICNMNSKKIEYDPNWLINFYALESYTGISDASLKLALENYIHMVDVINGISDVNNRREYHMKYLLRDEYCTASYNYCDLNLILLECIYGNGFFWRFNKPWNEQHDIQKLIDDYADKYYYVIENWIFSYMLKNKLTVAKYYLFELDLLQWLFKSITINGCEKPIFNDSGTLKRFIATFAFKAVMSIEGKSSKLQYELGCITLCK